MPDELAILRTMTEEWWPKFFGLCASHKNQRLNAIRQREGVRIPDTPTYAQIPFKFRGADKPGTRL